MPPPLRLSSLLLFLFLPSRRSGESRRQTRHSAHPAHHWVAAIAVHPRHAGHPAHHLAAQAPTAEHSLHHAPHFGVLLNERVDLCHRRARAACDSPTPV